MKLSRKLNALAIGFALVLLCVGYSMDKAVQVDTEASCHTGARYDKSGDIFCPQFASK
jgi:hypothetical protein